jgi:hypothetical protein
VCKLSSAWKVINVHTVYLVNTRRWKHLLDSDIDMKIILNERGACTELIHQARRVASGVVQLTFRVYRSRPRS